MMMMMTRAYHKFLFVNFSLDSQSRCLEPNFRSFDYDFECQDRGLCLGLADAT